MEDKTIITRPQMEDLKNIGSGVFSNIINIASNGKEVFFDFGLSFPREVQKKDMSIELVSRVVLSREHALEFSKILEEFLKQK